MSEISCTACQELREDAPEFVTNGVTSAVCSSLANDTGLDSTNGNNDATDLHNANDCLIGRMYDEIDAYDVCDWKEFMKRYIRNEYEVNKAIICALGGLWSLVHKLIEAMGGGGGVIPVIRKYRTVVPVEAFMPIWRVTQGAQDNYTEGTPAWQNRESITEWFAGSGNNTSIGEFWIKVPVSEMEDIIGVWTQSYVVPTGNPYDGRGKPYVQTVNVQQWSRSGAYLDINFDTYEICPPGGGTTGTEGGPYPVTVDFLVVGTRTLV